MESNTVQRRLAAILAADVVGYSRLMGTDEVGTLRELKAHRRELIDPAIAAHRGRMVKTTGDGALVEFASVVDAVGVVTGITFTCQRVLVGRSRPKRNQALGTLARAQKARKERLYWLDVTMPSRELANPLERESFDYRFPR